VISDSEINAAISEARKSILGMSECENQYFIFLGIRFMIQSSDLWHEMNQKQRKAAMEFADEIQQMAANV
jgi:hypothetical protein